MSSDVETGNVTANTYNVTDDDYISAKVEGDVSYLKLEVNGKEVSSAGSFTSNDVQYYVGKNNLKTTDKVYLNAYSANYKQLAHTEVKLTETPKTPVTGTITPSDKEYSNSKSDAFEKVAISGDVSYIIIRVNGTQVNSAGGLTGQKSTTVYLAGIAKVGDTITLEAHGSDYSTVDSVDMKVVA